MSERKMRLIDANALRKRKFGYYACVNENTNKRNYKGGSLMTYEVADLINDCIDNAPTVRLVNGKWVSLEPEIGLFECAECGHRILRAECNYCPNCGAKMGANENGNEPNNKA